MRWAITAALAVVPFLAGCEGPTGPAGPPGPPGLDGQDGSDALIYFGEQIVTVPDNGYGFTSVEFGDWPPGPAIVGAEAELRSPNDTVAWVPINVFWQGPADSLQHYGYAQVEPPRVHLWDLANVRVRVRLFVFGTP